MTNNFAKLLIKESRAFLKLAKQEKKDRFIKEMYTKASLVFAWFGLEGVMNLMCSDFLTLKNLSFHERAFLEEKNIEFSDGEFFLRGSRYRSTKDKLLYLLKKFGNYEISKRSKLWIKLSNFEDMRNALAHPKKGKVSIRQFKIKNAEEGLETSVLVIKILYKKIYNKNITFLEN